VLPGAARDAAASAGHGGLLLNSLLPRTATDTDSQRPHRNCPLANNVEYVEHEARCDLCVVRSCRGRYCACRVQWTTC